MWERELELIESLGKLYPSFINQYGECVEYKFFRTNNYYKAEWIHWLCLLHLKRRLPQLEEFMKINDPASWRWYKNYFGMMDWECGKEN